MAPKATGKRSVGRDGTLHVHGKASNGEGSIYRDSDGAWRATYSVPGEARPRRVRGKTREEAIARRTAKDAELPIRATDEIRDQRITRGAERQPLTLASTAPNGAYGCE